MLRGCLRCAHLFVPGETFYTCTVCENWDLCQRCFSSVAGTPQAHQHRMCEEELAVELPDAALDAMEHAACSAEALLIAFRAYGSRHCLGRRARRPDGSLGDTYTWLSYHEAFAHIRACAEALQQLIGSKQEQQPDNDGQKRVRGALLFGESSVEWLVAYFAVLMGTKLAIVPLNSYLSFDALVHLARLLAGDVAVVFCSAHLQPLLSAAFARAGTALSCPIVVINDSAEAYIRRHPRPKSIINHSTTASSCGSF